MQGTHRYGDACFFLFLRKNIYGNKKDLIFQKICNIIIKSLDSDAIRLTESKISEQFNAARINPCPTEAQRLAR